MAEKDLHWKHVVVTYQPHPQSEMIRCLSRSKVPPRICLESLSSGAEPSIFNHLELEILTRGAMIIFGFEVPVSGTLNLKLWYDMRHAILVGFEVPDFLWSKWTRQFAFWIVIFGPLSLHDISTITFLNITRAVSLILFYVAISSLLVQTCFSCERLHSLICLFVSTKSSTGINTDNIYTLHVNREMIHML